MIKYGKKLYGFTLVEVLVATSIFAVIMIITTGIVAQSSTYRSKLAVLRQANEETRKIADVITRDVRSANQTIKITAFDDAGSGATSTRQFKNGIALINYACIYSTGCPGGLKFYRMAYSSAITAMPGEIHTNSDAQALILGVNDKYKIYLFSDTANPKGLFYKELNRLNPDGSVYSLTMTDIAGVVENVDGSKIETNRISSGNLNLVLTMTGFAPDDLSATAEPYIQFMLTAKTPDYDTDQAHGAKSVLRSSVTSRSYNN